MKVYFCGSIRGGRDDVHVYRRIVHALQSYGSVLTEHVSSSEISERGEAGGDRAVHHRDVDWLRQSDGESDTDQCSDQESTLTSDLCLVVVAEVTQPSLGVGYELGRAVAMETKVLCLFRPASGRSLSAMIRGAEDGDRFVVKDYREDEVENVLEEFFNCLKRT
ncbi:2'-deoxynucleoside 5'-phosphate N-hydrolase 1 isoform X2 [Pseudoliparis swirei]|uniref:2'-deoxynucleoside 5'-phosphate N-hydrolase 1 isoform X2 n=1 Tax=Pseudoliparis swirei TaxID=2059687 RepID=UPI0024BD91A2|nr:2'-deoxynucleoside 5'-phosphate N-hydrolase 1 isoform X2 [Pseudoliparis swirei]